jgi:hypothetical protein
MTAFDESRPSNSTNSHTVCTAGSLNYITSYFITNPREVFNVAAVCDSSEAIFAIIVRLNARLIIQNKRREQ